MSEKHCFVLLQMRKVSTKTWKNVKTMDNSRAQNGHLWLSNRGDTQQMYCAGHQQPCKGLWESRAKSRKGKQKHTDLNFVLSKKNFWRKKFVSFSAFELLRGRGWKGKRQKTELINIIFSSICFFQITVGKEICYYI